MEETGVELRDKRRDMMLSGSAYKVIPVIATPLILSMLIDSVYNMTDAYFVSSMGHTAVAAVGINDSLLGYMRAVSMCFGTGAASVLSRMLGAGRDREANAVATTTLLTAIAVLTLVSAAAYIFADPLVSLLGATKTVKPYSLEYARFILLSAPFTAGEVVASFLLRSEGSARLSMWGICSGCIANMILDPIMILPWGLGLGVAGAAIATDIGKMISFAILITPFLRKKTLLELHPKHFSPKWSVYRDVIKMGIPSTVRDVLMTSSWVVMNNAAGEFGDAALSAITVSKKVINLVSSAIAGIGQGYQPLAGFCWGAKKYGRVRETFKACTVLGWSASLILGAVLSVFARSLASLFADPTETEVIRLATIIIVSQSATLIAHVWGVVINGLCQAGGHPVYSIIVGLSRNFICLIPSVLLLSRLFGVEGLTLAGAAGDIISLAICIPIVVRLLRECREKEKLQEENLPSV